MIIHKTYKFSISDASVDPNLTTERRLAIPEHCLKNYSSWRPISAQEVTAFTISFYFANGKFYF